MATFTTTSKSTSTFTQQTKLFGGATLPSGSPIGLLLTLTIAADSSWATTSRSSPPTYTSLTRN